MSLNNSDIIVQTSTGYETQAQALAQSLGLSLHDQTDALEGFALRFTTAGLTLLHPDKKQVIELRADWLHGKAAYRQGQPEMISRALTLGKLDQPHVVDATAGLGRDTVVIAGLGADVSAIERSPIIHALIDDAHRRAIESEAACSWANRIKLFHSNAIEGIGSIAAQRDIDEVFLDPMYPEKRKNAKAKKDMAMFQALLGKDPLQEEDLLTAALDHAIYRVVVKRPVKGELLAGKAPSFSIKGRSTRYDVYTKKKIS